MRPSDTITISADTKKTGTYKADKVIQLDVHDVVASIARPVQELKVFRRITLEPGEKQQVQFVLKPDQVGFYNNHTKVVAEPGIFEVMVGSSSEDIRSRGIFGIK